MGQVEARAEKNLKISLKKEQLSLKLRKILSGFTQTDCLSNNGIKKL